MLIVPALISGYLLLFLAAEVNGRTVTVSEVVPNPYFSTRADKEATDGHGRRGSW